MIRQRKDANQAALLQVAAALGAHCIVMDRSAGFDTLIVTPKGNYIVEIKNPAERWSLTDAEIAQRQAIEYAGGRYLIVEYDWEMVAICRGEMKVIDAICAKGDSRRAR